MSGRDTRQLLEREDSHCAAELAALSERTRWIAQVLSDNLFNMEIILLWGKFQLLRSTGGQM